MADMSRTLPIALIALLCGAVAGGVAGAVAGGDSSSSTAALPLPAAAATTSGDRLTPAAVYQRDAPGVAVITATSTKQVPGDFFTPPETEKVQSLGSGFVIDRS